MCAATGIQIEERREGLPLTLPPGRVSSWSPDRRGIWSGCHVDGTLVSLRSLAVTADGARAGVLLGTEEDPVAALERLLVDR